METLSQNNLVREWGNNSKGEILVKFSDRKPDPEGKLWSLDYVSESWHEEQDLGSQTIIL